MHTIVFKSSCLRTTATSLGAAGWRQRHAAPATGAGRTVGGGADASDGGSSAAGSAASARQDAAAERQEAAVTLRLPGSVQPTAERLQTVLGARHAGVAVVLENVRKARAMHDHCG